MKFVLFNLWRRVHTIVEQHIWEFVYHTSVVTSPLLLCFMSKRFWNPYSKICFFKSQKMFSCYSLPSFTFCNLTILHTVETIWAHPASTLLGDLKRGRGWEHLFLACSGCICPVTLPPREHIQAYRWWAVKHTQLVYGASFRERCYAQHIDPWGSTQFIGFILVTPVPTQCCASPRHRDEDGKLRCHTQIQ